MNIIEKIVLKRKLKRCIKKNESSNLCNIIDKNKEILKELNEKEIDALIEWGINNNRGISVLDALISVANPEQRKKIIDYMTNQRYFYDKRYIHEKYFDEYLRSGFEQKYDNLLYYLGLIAARNPKKYENQIIQLRNYYKSMEVDYRFINLVTKQAFYCEELIEKILERENKALMDFLRILDIEKINNFLYHYFIRLDMDDFKSIVKEFETNKEIYNSLLSVIQTLNSNEPGYEYLYIMYEIIRKEELIDLIILSGDLTTIKKLMKLLEGKKQIQICEEYIEKGNYKNKLDLACSTDCVTTYKLIDDILENNFLNKNIEEIVYLVSNLEGRFVSYALNKIIINHSEYYLLLIDKLYLYGLSNTIEAINFIFVYKFEYLFKKDILHNLLTFKEEQEKNKSLTLTKNL